MAERYRPRLVPLERPATVDATEPLILNLMLRKSELFRYTGLKRTTIDRLIGEGSFPRPVHLGGGRAVAWLGSEIARWQQERKAERDAAMAEPDRRAA